MSFGSPWPQSATLGELTERTRPICYGVLKPGPADPAGIPLVRVCDISANEFDGTKLLRITPELDEEFARSRLDGGELLISVQGTIGRVAICPREHAGANVSRTIAVIAPDERVDRHFLYWYLRRAGELTLFETVGTTRASLNIATLREVRIPLPPLPEQRRIADILDKADAVRRKRKEAIALTEELLRSAFLEMVGPNAPAYGRWPEVVLERLAAPTPSSMRTGPFGSDLRHSEFVDAGVAVLGIDNAVQNQFAWDERRYITHEKYEKLQRYRVKPSDVIVTIMGTTGRSAVVPDDIPLAITTKHLATITLNRDLAEPEFVSQTIHRHPAVLAQIRKANRGAIMSGLNLGLIRSLVVRLPPLEQQRRFTQVTKDVRRLSKKLARAHGASEALFDSLVQRAFRGELTGAGSKRQLGLFGEGAHDVRT